MLFSAAFVVKVGVFQSALLSSSSEHPVEAVAVYESLVGGRYEDVAVFTQLENSHLYDVEAVLTLLEFVLLGLLVAMAGFGWYLRHDLPLALIWGGCVSLALLFVFAIVPFDVFFDAFHGVFFPQGNWQFPESSVMLSYYPYSYFSSNAFWIGFVDVVLSIVTMSAGYFFGSQRRKVKHMS